MVLEVQPVSINDAPAFVDMSFASYSEDPLFKSIFPTMNASDSLRNFHVNAMKSGWGKNPYEFRKCARDTETGEIVSAMMYSYEPQQEGEDWKKAAVLPEHPEMDNALFSHVLGEYWALRVKHMGAEPFIFLGSLTTFPRFQGRGGASMLVKHAVKHAEDLNLPVFLQASPAGHQLYLRHGFVDLEEIKVDISKKFPDAHRSSYAMLRARPNPSQPPLVPAPRPTLDLKVSRLEDEVSVFVSAHKLAERAFGPNETSTLVFGGCTGNTNEIKGARDLERARAVPDYWFYKATDPVADPEGKTMLGYAKWFIIHDPHLDHRPYGPEWPEGCNVPAADAMFKEIRLRREKYFRTRNKPYAFMLVLTVAPEAQRRGVGSALLREGLKEVDKMGYDTWIDASPEGLGLYRKFGWEEITKVTMGLKQYGGPDIEESVVGLFRKCGAEEKK